jgi:hypothetical protein
MPGIVRIFTRPLVAPRFELGDRVILQPGNKVGIVIGVRYGEIAYDVRCGGECLRNLCPKQIRLAPPALSVVEASIWQWNLWGGMPRLPNGVTKVPA